MIKGKIIVFELGKSSIETVSYPLNMLENESRIELCKLKSNSSKVLMAVEENKVPDHMRTKGSIDSLQTIGEATSLSDVLIIIRDYNDHQYRDNCANSLNIQSILTKTASSPCVSGIYPRMLELIKTVFDHDIFSYCLVYEDL